jgi:anaerobic selenocysteine-containing dehydrogenase
LPDTRPAACPLDCPDACSLEVTLTDGRVTRLDGSERNPVTAGYICAKVRRFPEAMYGEARVLKPLVRVGPKGEAAFHDVSWDKALDLVAERLDETRRLHGGEAILPFYYGGSNGLLSQGTTDARLFRRLGASNLDRTVCAVPTGRAAQGLYGKMAGVSYPDYVHARLIVAWGVNPAVSGIHLMPFIQEAQKRGAKLAVIDPRRTKIARRADLHLAPHPGTDLPLALAVLNLLFENGWADERFLAGHADGAERLRRAAAMWTVEKAAGVCRITAPEIEQFARLYARTSPAVIRCGWGLERNRNGGSAAAAVLALPAVAGKFRVRGGGYTLSNSGAWGLSAEASAGEPKPPVRTVNMNELGKTLAPDAHTPVMALFVYNCNPLATMPEQEKVRQGLLREDLFTVVFDPFLTDTARYADVVLPAATFLERRELVKGYGTSALQSSEAAAAPVGESRTNHEVFSDLVRRLGLARPGDAETEDEVQRAILAAHPDGERLAANLAEDTLAEPGWGTTPIQLVDVFPGTPDRRAHLFPDELDREAPDGLYAYRPDPADGRHPLALISPSTDKTISSSLGQLRREAVPLRIHPADAEPRGIGDGDRVRIVNDSGEVICRARIDPDLRAGMVELPKGLWSHNTENGATANALAPDSLTDLGGGACFNDARVQVVRLDGEPR